MITYADALCNNSGKNSAAKSGKKRVKRLMRIKIAAV